MIYGFDYWKVLSHHKRELKPLISALISQGHQVHIISAAGINRAETTPEAIKKLDLPKEVNIHMVFWQGHNHQDAPKLKLEKAKELNIDLFFDDRADTCKYFAENGIPAFQAPFYKYFENNNYVQSKI